MKTITLQEILTTYWSQFTLVLFGVGYLLKIWLDTKYKKTEINHNLFQQRKLDSLNKFFFTYSVVHQIWYDLPAYSASRGKFTATELDEMIFPTLNELRGIVLELKIYFDDDINEIFENIYKSFLTLNKKLKGIVFNPEPETTPFLIAEFETLRDETFKVNAQWVVALAKEIKKDYR